MPAVQTPDWVKDAIFYQIFPDRFAKSDALRVMKPNNLEPWDSPPTAYGYKGGDLLGVVEHLDHIQDLGATALYFCPIFQSGGNDAFMTLLNEAHQRGMKVVLDGVFNHTSRGFFYFNDILENGPASPYVDWFTVNEFPPNAYDLMRPPGYAAWWGLHALPKFNTDNPQVREYIMRVAEHWLRLGIDGWRLDVPAEIKTEGFWEEFRERVKAINREAYLVGEIWEAAVPFLQGDRFDAVMNYLFAEAVLAFCAGPRINPEMAEGRGYNPAMRLDATGYADRIDWILSLYPWDIQLAQLNLLDSHDAARAITLAGGDAASVHLATLLLMTYPGAPSIYYGDEIGLEGGLPDYDTRRPFPWDHPALWTRDVLAYHKELIALRRAHPALRRGTYHRLYSDADVYAFGRRLEADVLLVVVNVAEEARVVEIPV
ncbi:MAG: glycoside hydrolase family 13 protein, partial [Chloroflexi bacterium]|nr:glycoside hydrolase family 13 protein [Chloroflexota bacterium]